METNLNLKILVLAFFHGLGHLSRSMSVAVHLKNRGHDVLFACSEEALHIPQQAGLTCKPIREIEPLPPEREPKRTQSSSQTKTRSRLANPEYLKRCIEEETLLMKEFNPDVVLHDYRLSAGVTSALNNIPSISLHNTNFFIYPLAQMIPDVIDTLNELETPQYAIQKLFGDIMVIPDFSTFDNLSHMPRSMREIVLNSVREIHHTGPFIKNQPNNLPSKTQLKNSISPHGMPLILITFGGTAMGFANYIKLLHSLRNIKAHYYVITGPNIDPDLLALEIKQFKGSNPDSILEIISFTNQALELMKAADLAIIHGGHTTVMEALMCGTPMIVIPQHEEQRLNAQRAVQLKLGEIVHPDEIEAKITSAIEKRLKSNHSQLGIQVANLLQRTNGIENLIQLIENDVMVNLQKMQH
ncbi:glycosyltransferase [Paenibacillus sp. MMS18-CY102]|uniref:glycosyltransferase n=1 Tax=Paenibacillus sp. MMS18-CY102 TaxID=2682849 RepID=UPI001365BA66|nr:glycosyltransferase [Paenibacillus sp. MMS18-CY102]